MQIGRLRGSGEQLAIQLYGAFVLAESHEGQGMERAIVTIGAVRGEQLRGLLLRAAGTGGA